MVHEPGSIECGCESCQVERALAPLEALEVLAERMAVALRGLLVIARNESLGLLDDEEALEAYQAWKMANGKEEHVHILSHYQYQNQHCAECGVLVPLGREE